MRPRASLQVVVLLAMLVGRMRAFPLTDPSHELVSGQEIAEAFVKPGAVVHRTHAHSTRTGFERQSPSFQPSAPRGLPRIPPLEVQGANSVDAALSRAF